MVALRLAVHRTLVVDSARTADGLDALTRGKHLGAAGEDQGVRVTVLGGVGGVGEGLMGARRRIGGHRVSAVSAAVGGESS